MKKKIILHIPHSSLKLPRVFKQNKFELHQNQIDEFNFAITDLYTDKLFSCNKFKTVKFKYSRIFCDVEKFADDNKESMSKYGMGVVYTKTNKQQKFFNPTLEYKQTVINKIYYPYHKKLTKIVKNSIRKNETILVDCHSFSKDIIMGGNTTNLPDICIGINNDKNYALVEYIKEYFYNLGYKVAINFPYSGTMYPNNINDKNNNLFCVMIEINRNLYLNDCNKYKNFKNNIDLQKFKLLKKQIFNLLKILKNYSIK